MVANLSCDFVLLLRARALRFCQFFGRAAIAAYDDCAFHKRVLHLALRYAVTRPQIASLSKLLGLGELFLAIFRTDGS